MAIIKIFRECFNSQECFGKSDCSVFEKHLLSAMDNDDFRFHQRADDFVEFAGFHPNYNGKIYIATVLPTITHEIAHLVEIDEERFMLPDFGIGGVGANCKNKLETNKKFLVKATAREERVIGIQKVIELGNKPNLYKKMSKVNYNSCWANFFVKAGFPIFKFQNLEEVKEWGFHVMKTATETWTQDKIEHIFFKRIEALRNNLHKSIKIAALAACIYCIFY